MIIRCLLFLAVCGFAKAAIASCPAGAIDMDVDSFGGNHATSIMCDNHNLMSGVWSNGLNRSMFGDFLSAKGSDPQIASAIQTATGKSVDAIMADVKSRPDLRYLMQIDVDGAAGKDALQTIVSAYNNYFHFDLNKPEPKAKLIKQPQGKLLSSVSAIDKIAQANQDELSNLGNQCSTQASRDSKIKTLHIVFSDGDTSDYTPMSMTHDNGSQKIGTLAFADSGALQNRVFSEQNGQLYMTDRAGKQWQVDVRESTSNATVSTLFHSQADQEIMCGKSPPRGPLHPRGSNGTAQ